MKVQFLAVCDCHFFHLSLSFFFLFFLFDFELGCNQFHKSYCSVMPLSTNKCLPNLLGIYWTGRNTQENNPNFQFVAEALIN